MINPYTDRIASNFLNRNCYYGSTDVIHKRNDGTMAWLYIGTLLAEYNDTLYVTLPKDSDTEQCIRISAVLSGYCQRTNRVPLGLYWQGKDVYLAEYIGKQIQFVGQLNGTTWAINNGQSYKIEGQNHE